MDSVREAWEAPPILMLYGTVDQRNVVVCDTGRESILDDDGRLISIADMA